MLSLVKLIDYCILVVELGHRYVCFIGPLHLNLSLGGGHYYLSEWSTWTWE